MLQRRSRGMDLVQRDAATSKSRYGPRPKGCCNVEVEVWTSSERMPHRRSRGMDLVRKDAATSKSRYGPRPKGCSNLKGRGRPPSERLLQRLGRGRRWMERMQQPLGRGWTSMARVTRRLRRRWREALGVQEPGTLQQRGARSGEYRWQTSDEQGPRSAGISQLVAPERRPSCVARRRAVHDSGKRG